MKNTAALLLLTIICEIALAQTGFLTEQKRYSRVRTAISDKKETIKDSLKKKGIALSEVKIIIVVYKMEGELEIFAKKKSEETYRKLTSYEICARSGALGPKRKEGDCQVPEGFYHIDRFNPASNFLLSLGLNYPNRSDVIKSNANKPGGDIFIHGSCITVGCLPMTDDKIKEIYLYAINAKNNGQENIPVYIFPFRMTERIFNEHKKQYENKPELIGFWENIKKGYDKFNDDLCALKISYAPNGDYIFNE